jgi:hypothetical protein
VLSAEFLANPAEELTPEGPKDALVPLTEGHADHRFVDLVLGRADRDVRMMVPDGEKLDAFSECELPRVS